MQLFLPLSLGGMERKPESHYMLRLYLFTTLYWDLGGRRHAERCPSGRLTTSSHWMEPTQWKPSHHWYSATKDGELVETHKYKASPTA